MGNLKKKFLFLFLLSSILLFSFIMCVNGASTATVGSWQIMSWPVDLHKGDSVHGTFQISIGEGEVMAVNPVGRIVFVKSVAQGASAFSFSAEETGSYEIQY